MDKKVKKLWVTALRSGKYKQTTGKLIRRDGSKPSYCCLGVLAKVQGAEFDKYGYPLFNGKSCGTFGLLDKSGSAGLAERSMEFLARLNDEGKDFNYIANQIEKRY